jgi:hypothetical protein
LRNESNGRSQVLIGCGFHRISRDNHDLSVYISWDPERIDGPPEEFEDIKQFFTQNLVFLKLRTSVLWSLSAAVDIIKSSDGVRTKHVDQLKNILQNWEALCAESRTRNHVPLRQVTPAFLHFNCFLIERVVQNQVTLPLPSRLHVALDTPHFEVVGNTFRVLLAAASECGAGEDLVKKIEGSLKTMMEMIEKRTEDEKNSNLVYRRETMEYVVNTVEILSLSSLVCLLCNDLVKPTQGKKGKKKVNESTSKELVNRLANSLKTHINELNNILQSWSDFSVSSDLSSMLESLNLNSDGHNVCENIVNSYVFACREIQSVLKSKIKMLNIVS